MKKNLRTLIMILSFSTSVLIAVAQENKTVDYKTPKEFSDKGFWVVESNIKTPKKSIVHFYNNDHVLIYSEKVEGVKLNVNRQQIRMRLNKLLDQSVIAWEKIHLRINEPLVKNTFKPR